MGPQPDFADALQSRLPPVLKWCFAGMGAAAGWYYARTDASPIPLSYIIGGAAAGFCLLALLFASMRLIKMLAIAGACFVVLNYALLIPLGYGDQLPVCLDAGRSVLRWLNPAPLTRRWGKNVEAPPHPHVTWP